MQTVLLEQVIQLLGHISTQLLAALTVYPEIQDWQVVSEEQVTQGLTQAEQVLDALTKKPLLHIVQEVELVHELQLALQVILQMDPDRVKPVMQLVQAVADEQVLQGLMHTEQELALNK